MHKLHLYFRSFIACVCSLVILVLSGCETTSPYDSLPNVIPTSERDGAPTRPKDVSSVLDAVPKYEPRTKAGNNSPYKVMGKVYYVNTSPKGYREKGIASWYGKKFHGRRTANGEVYNMYAMTAAHPTLPIPSYVRVTNLNNFRSIVVRVNDRGPFHPGRVIDLSYAGAYKLGYLNKGTAPVSVEYIDTDAMAPKGHVPAVLHESGKGGDGRALKLYYQLGAFGREQGAESLQQRASRSSSLPVHIIRSPSPKGGSLFKVQVGPVVSAKDRSLIEALKRDLNIDRSVKVYR